MATGGHTTYTVNVDHNQCTLCGTKFMQYLKRYDGSFQSLLKLYQNCIARDGDDIRTVYKKTVMELLNREARLLGNGKCCMLCINNLKFYLHCIFRSFVETLSDSAVLKREFGASVLHLLMMRDKERKRCCSFVNDLNGRINELESTNRILKEHNMKCRSFVNDQNGRINELESTNRILEEHNMKLLKEMDQLKKEMLQVQCGADASSKSQSEGFSLFNLFSSPAKQRCKKCDELSHRLSENQKSCEQLKSSLKEKKDEVLKIVSEREHLLKAKAGNEVQSTEKAKSNLTRLFSNVFDDVLSKSQCSEEMQRTAEVYFCSMFQGLYDFIASSLMDEFKSFVFKVHEGGDESERSDLTMAYTRILLGLGHMNNPSKFLTKAAQKKICDSLAPYVQDLLNLGIDGSDIKKLLEVSTKTVWSMISTVPPVISTCEVQEFSHKLHDRNYTEGNHELKDYRLVYTQPILFSNFKGHCLSKGYVTKAPVKVVDERDFFECDAMELLSRKLENWKDFCKMIHFQEEEIYPSEYQIQCMTKAVEENKGLSDSICVLLQA